MIIVYILYSAKLNRFYTGATSEFELRWEFHKYPEERKYTAKAQDWEIYLKIQCSTKKQALAIEKHIKSMKSSIYIENLKKFPEMQVKLLKKFDF